MKFKLNVKTHTCNTVANPRVLGPRVSPNWCLWAVPTEGPRAAGAEELTHPVPRGGGLRAGLRESAGQGRDKSGLGSVSGPLSVPGRPGGQKSAVLHHGAQQHGPMPDTGPRLRVLRRDKHCPRGPVAPRGSVLRRFLVVVTATVVTECSE